MKVLILAGGLGTRLYPLTFGRPKSMVPVANKPFLERVLGWLKRYQLTDITLALNYSPDRIMHHLHDGSAFGVKLRYLIEDSPLGSGGAIKNAAQLLGNEPFLVLNGDILTAINLKEMIDFHRQNNSLITISLARVEDPSHYGVVAMEANGRLTRFVEKPPAGEAPSNYINSGVWIFESSVLDEMPPAGTPFSIEREFWPNFLQEGKPMFGFANDSYWIDIGTVQRYLQAHKDLLAGRIAVELAEKQVSPGIWLGEGAKIEPGAALQAPMIIGAHTRICAGAEISNSVIGPGCNIADGAILQGSVLWEEVEVGKKAKMVDSVIGAGQKIGENRQLCNAAIEDLGAKAPQNN